MERGKAALRQGAPQRIPLVEYYLGELSFLFMRPT